MKHWFWHIIALCILVARDPSPRVTDEDWEWYKDFMKRHGFEGTP